jgi:uncharacterized protein
MSSDDPLTQAFHDEFTQQLLSTKAIRRLQGITFLGAIDYLQPGNGAQVHRRRNNRFEHTVGVARLVAAYCSANGAPLQTRRSLLAAALLHDVGHGPLSHSLEPVFKTVFNLDHHSRGVAHLRGQSRLGLELEALFSVWRIDRENLIEIISGNSTDKFSEIFKSTHNADTIEAITRSYAMVRRSSVHRSAQSFLESIWLKNDDPLNDADEFWHLKDAVYRLIINGLAGRFMDSVAQSYMLSNIGSFSARDFDLTERQFMKKHRPLFILLSNVLPMVQFRASVSEDMLSQKVQFTTRRFFVDTARKDFSGRYKQSKRKNDVELAGLVGSREEEKLTQYKLELCDE